MRKVGIATLPLHYGTAPKWLFERMVKLAKGIIEVIVNEYSAQTLLERFADPYWFQCFSCTLGYDWHSSGTTTVTCGAIKEAVRGKEEAFNIAVCGGKGKTSKKTLQELDNVGKIFDIDVNKMKRNSKLVAKVDSACIQDFHDLYHHTFFVTSSAEWCVIQQGMCTELKTARRYHWWSGIVKDFTEEPHKGIIGNYAMDNVLNMTAKESTENKKVTLEIIQDNIYPLYKSIVVPQQKTLFEFQTKTLPQILQMPKNVNWKIMRGIYDTQPENYEQLILIPGVGKETVRALALISELIYGAKASWKDPIKYTFAVGGKDGVPYTVNRKVMDKTIEILNYCIENAKISEKDKFAALKRVKNIDMLPIM